MTTAHFGDYQNEIYTGGLAGRLPTYPVDFATLERKAAQALPSAVDGFPSLADLRHAGARRL